MNTTKVVYISDIIPDANGELLVDFSTTAAAQWGFNGGLIIQEYSDAQGGSILYMSNSTLDSTTSTAAIAVTNDFKVKVYPNPFSDNVNIDFTNPTASSKVSAEVYDLTGRLVMRQHYNSMPAGQNTLRLNSIRSNNNGVYIIALRVDGKIVQTVKMLRNKR